MSHSQRITNSVCDLYQCSDVCMRHMFTEETEAMNEWIIGLTKRSYRYRILSPVICLLSLSYLARQKYTLSHPAGVCMNVEPLQIILLFHFFVLHLDLLLLCVVTPRLGCSSACNSGQDSSALFSCHGCCRRCGDCRELLLTPSVFESMQTQYDEANKNKNTLVQSHSHYSPKRTCTVTSLCPGLSALTTIKQQWCQMYPHVSSLENLQWVCAERKGHVDTHAHTRTHTRSHIQLQARNTLGCWIMRVDRAELSLHITIILSFSQLPQHLPWRCDISILLEFNLGPLNKAVACRPFPNGPSPILITWN